MTQSNAIATPTPPADPPRRLSTWWSEGTEVIKVATAICGLGQAVIAVILYVDKWAKLLGAWNWVVFFCFQVVLLIITFAWVKSHPPHEPDPDIYPMPGKDEGPSEAATVKKFFKYWKALIISWLAFYACMTVWLCCRQRELTQAG